MTSDVMQAIERMRIVPLIVIDDPDNAPALGRALAAGGLPCAEVAFRTPGAQHALERMAAECPDVLVGAGTVINETLVNRAHKAGARFIVAPGLNEHVVRRSQELGLPVFPGVCTPTEIEAALGLGLSVLKFFPAEAIGGLPFLKAIAAPYVDVRFMPTGGITAAHLASYLGFHRVVACGGSWMAPQAWVEAKAFDRIRDEVAAAVRTVESITMARQA
ncbi:MAG: bifunctional 4-hydroxy-2-oxoglutarate aldolase/2-dehydro-3-deoxy-phosphogluconate aldolase [Cytophagaceae bacterium]|nr:bifunctional 4-hydroxy-2-oxoglutarate aldolase/2-dehydro-3-deoxy-phosphogluconate aldolase [Gemmatimonadaceae bacterium]